MAVKAFSRTMCPRRSLNNEEELAWREVALFASEESAEKLELGRRSKIEAVIRLSLVQWCGSNDVYNSMGIRRRSPLPVFLPQIRQITNPRNLAEFEIRYE